MGSFYVGGRDVEISGKTVKEAGVGVPNGHYQVDQMYVQYFLPQNRSGKYPLLLWHGGGLTGASYESTPDGREGWLNIFIRKGWDVYNSDAVERGRSGFAPPDIWKGEPSFLSKAYLFELFRVGQGAGSWDPDPAKMRVNAGSQFPVEAYDNFTKGLVPLWSGNYEVILAAYTALVDKVCPCILLLHSQAGAFGFPVAQARPDKIKAIVAIEPSDVGSKAEAKKVKDIPILLLYGDYIYTPLDSRWPTMRRRAFDYADAVRAAGGSVDVINLPAIGIKGNSHMLMMDKNNGQIADVIQKWLTDKGLAD